MAINAKTREEIQNANSQLNTRARFQTPILTSPSHEAFLPFYALREGYEASPGEDNGAVVSNWRWYSSSRTRSGLFPPKDCPKTCCLNPDCRRPPWMQTRPFARRSSFTLTSSRWITKWIARMAPGRQRHLRALPDVPIVMFTLYKTDELERAANQIGIRRVIGKEEGVQTLLCAMEQLLSAA